jgi:CHASE1-domain containing sensor protein
MTVQDWTAIVVAIVTALAGVTAMLQFLVKHYLSELKPNGGSSVKDQVNRLEARVDDIYRLLCERTSK